MIFPFWFSKKFGTTVLFCFFAAAYCCCFPGFIFNRSVTTHCHFLAGGENANGRTLGGHCSPWPLEVWNLGPFSTIQSEGKRTEDAHTRNPTGEGSRGRNLTPPPRMCSCVGCPIFPSSRESPIRELELRQHQIIPPLYHSGSSACFFVCHFRSGSP